MGRGAGGGISIEGLTDSYRLDTSTLAVIRGRDEILGPVVRTYSRAAGPEFLQAHDDAQTQ